MSHFHVATACQLFIFTFIFNFLLQFIHIQFTHIFGNKTNQQFYYLGDSFIKTGKNCLNNQPRLCIIYDKVIQQKIVTKQDCKMGCTDSSAVVDNTHKLKPLTVNIEKVDSDNILMGEIDQQKFISVNVIVRQHDEEPIIIQERSLPTLIDKQGQTQKTKLPNFGQLVKINASGFYILTGGISYKLDRIYNETYLFNSKTNKLFKLGELKQARYTHSSVVYQDKVYVIGGRYFGQDDKAILNKCQYLKLNIKANQNLLEQQLQNLICKKQDSWQQLPDMAIKRCSHISVLYNKRIYVVGGYTGQYQRSTVIQYLDLQTNQWNTLPFQLPYGLQSCTTLSVQPNRVVIFGGNSNSGPIDSVMELCFLSGSEGAKARSKLKKKRVLHKLFQNGNHAWLLGGNQNMDMQLYSLAEQNSQQQQKIKQKKSKKIKNPLFAHFSNQSILQSLTQTLVTLSPVYNVQASSRPVAEKKDQIAVIFGTDTQPFILQLNISVPYAYCHSMPLSIKLFALQGVIYLSESDEYLLYGGISDSQEQVSSQTFVFNLKDFGKSRKIGNMNMGRYAFGSRRIGDWIYAIGGGAADQQGQLMIINKCERLNIKSISKTNEKKEAKWEQIANLPIGLISPMSINHKNRLYIFGGMKQNKQRYQNILRLSESGSVWQQISFKFPFGLEASSIHQKNQSQYLIFGGRVVNGDTANIWALTFINNGDDCVFEERGKMKQSKCLHHVYKPKHQNFVVVLGGEKEVLSFYDSDSLKPIQSDILTGLKQLFVENLGSLSDKSLKNYTMAIKE